MSLLNNSLITWLNRPYLDLEDFNSGPWHIYGIEYSYRNLVQGISKAEDSTFTNPVTMVQPSSFRESLIRESRLFEYQVSNPLQLADGLRTERWKVLCDYLNHYQELETSTRLQVIQLLSSLCLHEAVLEYVPEIPELEIANSKVLASLALTRAFSSLAVQTDAGGLDNVQEFEKIADHAPLGSGSRLAACCELLVLFATTFRNLKAAEHWATLFSQALDNLRPSLNDFQEKRLTSVYHRATVFVPLLQGDREAVVREMDLCQSLAEDLTRESKNEMEQIFAHDNLTAVLESRAKEALWLGNIDQAEARGKKVVEMEPLYSSYRLQLGEVLIKQGKFEEAGKMYRSAARLGPPGTAIAWFMAGQCHEQLGELDVACDCYLASVQMDELAISAVEKLTELAPRLGNSALASWSEMRLPELREEQKNYERQSRTSYIPGASSALKVAGEEELAQLS